MVENSLSVEKAGNKLPAAPLPILRKDLEFHKSSEREWYIFDPLSEKYFHLGYKEYQFIRELATHKTMDELRDSLSISQLNVSESEVAEFIDFLTINKLIYLPASKLEIEMLALSERKPKMWLSSYLYLKFPILNPDRFISATEPFFKIFFSPFVLVVLSFGAIYGYVSLIPEFVRYRDEFVLSMSFRHLSSFIILIAVIKSFHELAHAYTAKHFGVRVRTMGFALIFFMPRLYTDLTDAWRLDRIYRFYTSSAGIIFELILGGYAVIGWRLTGDGTFHSLCFYLFTISVLNSLLFNGNPLMRFDGYFMLSDLLELKNMGQRASLIFQRWRYRYFWGITIPKKETVLGTTRGVFLYVYGICSFIYRIFLYASIITLVYFKFVKWIGLLLAIHAIYLFFITPIIKEIKFVKNNISAKNIFKVITTLLILSCFVTMIFIPFKFTEMVPCEIDSASREIIYVDTPGYLNEILEKTGNKVDKGEPLFELSNPLIEGKLKDKLVEIKIAKLNLHKIDGKAKTRRYRNIFVNKIKSIESICDDFKRKLVKLSLTSKIDGTLVVYENSTMGRWLKTGTAVGEVFDKKNIIVNLYVENKSLSELSELDSIQVHPNNDKKGFIVELDVISKTPIQSALNPLTLKLLRDKNRYKDKVFYKITSFPLPKPKKGNGNIIGRTGMAAITTRMSVYSKLSKIALTFFRTEY